MTVSIEYEASKKLEFEYEELVNKVITACLDYEECPYDAEVSVLFTDDEIIRQINLEFRSKDAPTDVLSFPAVDYDTPGDFSKLEDNIAGYFNPETGELILGDIVISVDHALVQAYEYGHTIEREIAFLTAHSMFHLFGYDHMEEKDAEVMEQKQNDVLEKLQISR
jgi:probable rRNA maturation factor